LASTTLIPLIVLVKLTQSDFWICLLFFGCFFESKPAFILSIEAKLAQYSADIFYVVNLTTKGLNIY